MYYHAYNCSIFAYIVRCYVRTQQTRDIDPMVGQVNVAATTFLVNLKVFVETVLQQ